MPIESVLNRRYDKPLYVKSLSEQSEKLYKTKWREYKVLQRENTALDFFPTFVWWLRETYNIHFKTKIK